jgi:ribonuclease PH
LPFARTELEEMLVLAELGIGQILEIQAEVLATPPSDRSQAAKA